MRKRTILTIAGLVFVLGACTTRGYRAEPVVSGDDQRGTDVPDISDDDAVKEQNCFRIEIWEDTFWSDDDENVGVACIVTRDLDGEG